MSAYHNHHGATYSRVRHLAPKVRYQEFLREVEVERWYRRQRTSQPRLQIRLLLGLSKALLLGSRSLRHRAARVRHS